jgi:hypothetical protein
MSRRPPTLLLAALAAAAALGVAGCGAVDGSPHAQGDPTPIGVDSSAPTAPAAPAVPGAPAPTGGGSSGGGAPAAAPGKGGSAPAPTAAAKVTALRATQQPTCPVRGTAAAPFSEPGTDVKIAWTVTGAPGAAVAVDDPDVYGAYGADFPASGSLSLAFPCEATGTTKHTYTVWPAGAHDAPRSITVSARSDG